MKGRIAQIISILAAAMILFGAAAQPGWAAAAVQERASEQVADQPTGAIDFRRPSFVLRPLGEQVADRPTGAIDPRELEAFMDGLMAAEMAAKHVPGATVAVVQDGRLLLAKGYGYANLEDRVPVDPERTLFRVGSVSKLFTWTAVMQLVEQGRLDLDADVNEYLDLTIPATYSEPITLRHLMSHTPGFEDGSLTMEKLHAERVLSLDAYLQANLPARLFPPGEVSAYSNYGTALAGYAVERVSGLPFYEYVEQHIFAPLGMGHSTFRQPLPQGLAVDLATGYSYANGQYVAGPFIFDQAYPAGSMSATAADVARFMIAHLQDGELDDQRLLQKETARRMHSRLFTPDPRLKGGVAHGFFEDTINGQRLLSHTGNKSTYMSGLYLIPGQNVGLFISTNSTGGITTLEAVKKAFLDRTYPAAEPPALQSSAGFAERIAPYLGEYTWSRTNFTTLEKMGVLMTPTRIRLDGEGVLIFSWAGQVLRFVEVERGLLQDLDDPGRQLVYRAGPGGRLFLINGKTAFFKTPWYGRINLHLLLSLSGSLLFLCALVAWPIRFFAGRRRQPPAAQATPLPARLARWAAALFGLLWLVSLLGISSAFADTVPGLGTPRLYYETPRLITVLLALLYPLGGLAPIILVFAVLAWVRGYWSLGGRIFYTLLALLAALLTWALIYWNLLL